MFNYCPAALKPYCQPKMLAILAWSFACGMPLALTTSTLAVYLLKTHFSLQAIGLFSLATLPYSLKYFFAPFIQTHSIPLLSRRLGRVRSWMLLTMTGIILALLLTGSLLLSNMMTVWPLFILTSFIVFCASLNDTAEAEYRIELLNKQEFGYGMAVYAIGYRLGMITGGGGALLLAATTTWGLMYLVMPLVVLVGMIAVLRQPQAREADNLPSTSIWQSYFKPIKKLSINRGWGYALILIIIYNYSDDLLSMMLNPFLLQSGFSIGEIGIWQGSVGGIMGMLGGILSGPLISKYGLSRILLSSIVMVAMSNLLFIPLASSVGAEGISATMRHLFQFQAITGNFAQGISTIAYITLIAKQCHHPYTATQNAFLTSVMAGAKVLFATTGGYLVMYLGWTNFFVHLAVISISILLVVIIYTTITRRALAYS